MLVQLLASARPPRWRARPVCSVGAGSATRRSSWPPRWSTKPVISRCSCTDFASSASPIPRCEIAAPRDRRSSTSRERCSNWSPAGDWQAAVFAQNVILEAMEYTVFRLHARRRRRRSRATCSRAVIADERRHAGFGENDLGRQLWRSIRPCADQICGRSARSSTRWCSACSKRRSTRSARRLHERHRLAGEYLDTVERLGFT